MGAATRKLHDEYRLGLSDQIAALLESEGLWNIASQLSYDRLDEHGGRPNTHPLWVYFLWEILIWPYRGSRGVEAELRSKNSDLWNRIRRAARRHLPDNPELWPGAEAPTRNMYNHALKNHLLRHGLIVKQEVQFHAQQVVVAIGLADPDEPGTSLSSPSQGRTLVGDGKVETPRSKYNPADPQHHRRRKVDPETGEISEPRHDKDAALHKVGGDEWAYGIKFVYSMVRGEGRARWVITNVDLQGDDTEVDVALKQLETTASALPGLQHWSYDKAARGKHMDWVMRTLGIIPLVRSHRAEGGAPRDRSLGRVPVMRGKRDHIDIHLVDGVVHARIRDLEGGNQLIKLERKRINHRTNKDGTHRVYGQWALPDELGGGHIHQSATITKDDVKRGFNRTEHLRLIPAEDVNFLPQVRTRQSIESSNHRVSEPLPGGRAHHYGAPRNLLSLRAQALLRNSEVMALWG